MVKNLETKTMGEATFNKGKWRDIKKAEFRKSLKNSMLGKHDKIVDKICDWHSSILDEVLSTKDIDTIEKAEKELKNIKYAKAFFIFSGATLFIFDSVNNIVEYKNLPVDTTGSSIDDGNNKLYPVNVFEFRQVKDKYHSNLRNKVI